jgi:hypothetical protein
MRNFLLLAIILIFPPVDASAGGRTGSISFWKIDTQKQKQMAEWGLPNEHERYATRLFSGVADDARDRAQWACAAKQSAEVNDFLRDPEVAPMVAVFENPKTRPLRTPESSIDFSGTVYDVRGYPRSVWKPFIDAPAAGPRGGEVLAGAVTYVPESGALRINANPVLDSKSCYVVTRGMMKVSLFNFLLIGLDELNRQKSYNSPGNTADIVKVRTSQASFIGELLEANLTVSARHLAISPKRLRERIEAIRHQDGKVLNAVAPR